MLRRIRRFGSFCADDTLFELVVFAAPLITGLVIMASYLLDA